MIYVNRVGHAFVENKGKDRKDNNESIITQAYTVQQEDIIQYQKTTF